MLAGRPDRQVIGCGIKSAEHAEIVVWIVGDKWVGLADSIYDLTSGLRAGNATSDQILTQRKNVRCPGFFPTPSFLLGVPIEYNRHVR